MYLKPISIVILIFFMMGCAQKSKTETNALYKDLDGNTVALSDFKGKKVLLNFWATWCVPCIEEMPSMHMAQKILASENYVFLFATTDKVEKINKFKEKHKFPFQYLQYQQSLDKLNIYALPVTFIYNTEGEMVKRIDGATEWNSEDMIKQLKAIQ